ncbi:unnamed protein product [Adineta ricciae]|uniref:Uncharacterized protein n=1 Tax=Adineta ricciae TaxID=249248 RepID=A0A815ZEY8_ADIRI|nr:unnamed protein product [Adineta ricciae]CAF1584205.1 unnamed protein product [Adineta ricciae]
MAPLTLSKKYDDLVRCADQPLSSYNKLNDDDLGDVISKSWPFIMESITYTPFSIDKSSSTASLDELSEKVYTKLERRLKIQFQLYSEAAKRAQQSFPNRPPLRQNKQHINTYLKDFDTSLSLDRSSEFSLENMSEINVPDFYVLCTPHLHDKDNVQQRQVNDVRLHDFIKATPQTSPYKMLVIKQALKDCCRCGTYDQLKNLCLAADTSIEEIVFANANTVLHECIILNNQQLAHELVRFKFNIEVYGELGTPLVTAMHYDILWAVEFLLKNGADLSTRHIDWPYLTLYEYCIQFGKISIKLMIVKHLLSLIRKNRYRIIRRLMNSGWNIPWNTRNIN